MKQFLKYNCNVYSQSLYFFVKKKYYIIITYQPEENLNMKTIITAINARYSHSSLAVRYLQKCCGGFDTETAEFSINDNIYDIYSALAKRNAEIYCFSCYIWNLRETVTVARMLKTAMPGSVIIFGGPEAAEYDFVDCVITGEGEEAIVQALTAVQNGEPLPREISGAAADLDRMPQPYTAEDLRSIIGKMVYFETARGCPFSCSYCLSSARRGIRYFPMEYVKTGLSMFFDNNVRLVKLVDRTFNCNPSRAAEIMRFTIDNSKSTMLHLEMAPHLITDEILALLSEAPNRFQLEMGIQSTNPQTLEAINRRFDLAVTAEKIKLATASGVHIHLDLIAGLPYEDIDSFRRSFEYVYSLRPHMLQLGFLKVLPGTAIRDFGGICHMAEPPYEVLSTEWLPSCEVFRLKDIENAVDRFYNSGAFSRTVELLSAEAPFEFFDSLGAALADAEKNGRLARHNIYEVLYRLDGGGDDNVAEAIALDFIQNNKDRPMLDFVTRDSRPQFKKRCLEYVQKNGIGLNDVRFEPIFGKVYFADYKRGTVEEVTALFD